MSHEAGAMIEIRNLRKSYGPVLALDDVSFRLEPGRLCGLLGRNGAGKSTLFKTLVGLVPPDRGELLLDGRPMPFGSVQFRRSVGYAPEADLLDDYLTVAEFLDFVGAIREIPAAARREAIDHWIEFFELTGKRDTLLIECSQGMRRKASLAAALLGDPRLLLLDESMNGLDPAARAALKHELRRFTSAGGTILFSTHVLETVDTLCDRVLVLVRGRLTRDLAAGEWTPGDGPNSLESLFIGAEREMS